MTNRNVEELSPGAVIRGARELRGWSQRELAERVGQIDAAGVSKIETGVTKLGRTRATRFARVLGVPLNQLLPVTPAQPSNQALLVRLEAIEGALEHLADRLAENQGLVTTALERLGALLLRQDERGLVKQEPALPRLRQPKH